eukprot:TRINITY_DN8317_c1_g1_i11.p4 TRINITY_DN8317_c1_g1~~TRINITY_DN8317_c1_g1_i11.p4  ORF type:complete len:200 (-),score=-11.43 TRINITY_DN8317_c1_g1_i11:2842-3441(-)
MQANFHRMAIIQVSCCNQHPIPVFLHYLTIPLFTINKQTIIDSIIMFSNYVKSRHFHYIIVRQQCIQYNGKFIYVTRYGYVKSVQLMGFCWQNRPLIALLALALGQMSLVQWQISEIKNTLANQQYTDHHLSKGRVLKMLLRLDIKLRIFDGPINFFKLQQYVIFEFIIINNILVLPYIRVYYYQQYTSASLYSVGKDY